MRVGRSEARERIYGVKRQVWTTQQQHSTTDDAKTENGLSFDFEGRHKPPHSIPLASPPAYTTTLFPPLSPFSFCFSFAQYPSLFLLPGCCSDWLTNAYLIR